MGGLLLIALVGLFLSLWIVVPGFNMVLFRLSVGAPEVSPWLIGVNAGAGVGAIELVRPSCSNVQCGGIGTEQFAVAAGAIDESTICGGNGAGVRERLSNSHSSRAASSDAG